MGIRVQVRAFAKINLHLAVHGRRPDGFHDLTTVFQAIALNDTLTVEAWDGPFVLDCGADGVPADATNLAWRAAALLADETGRELAGLRLTLHKQIPTQAGLGGGSADAMATLRALHTLWGVPMDVPRLARLGARLGADVAFFAHGGAALGTGRGDCLEPLADVPAHHVVIVRPTFGVSTAAAYGWLAEDRARRPMSTEVPVAWPAHTDDWASRLGTMTNDFEPVVSRRHPEVGEAIARLTASGAPVVLMSGSGSAVVALFRTGAEATKAAEGFAGVDGWQLWLSRTMTRAEYQAACCPGASAPG